MLPEYQLLNYTLRPEERNLFRAFRLKAATVTRPRFTPTLQYDTHYIT